jgi:hypothetical protein
MGHAKTLTFEFETSPEMKDCQNSKNKSRKCFIGTAWQNRQKLYGVFHQHSAFSPIITVNIGA